MVCDVSFFKVKLVQEGLPIKQVVKWLRSNFKESWPTSKETASEPEGDPACDECKTQNIVSFPCPWPGSPWYGTEILLAAWWGSLFFLRLAVIFIFSCHTGQHLATTCWSILLSLGDQVGGGGEYGNASEFGYKVGRRQGKTSWGEWDSLPNKFTQTPIYLSLRKISNFLIYFDGMG